MAERHRLRIAVDVIHEGPKLSPSAQQLVAKEFSTLGHVIAFQDIKNIEVVYTDPDERVTYTHYHDGGSGYCDMRSGCLQQAQDELNQEDL